MKWWTLALTILAAVSVAQKPSATASDESIDTCAIGSCLSDETAKTLSLYISTGEGKSISARNCFVTLYATPTSGKHFKGLAVNIKGSYQLARKGRVFLAVASRLNESRERQTYKLRIDTNGDGTIYKTAYLIPEENQLACGEPASLDIGIYGLARRIRYGQQETVLDLETIRLKPIFENCKSG